MSTTAQNFQPSKSITSNTTQEYGYNSIFIHRHLNNGEYHNVTYYLQVLTSDINSNIILTFTFSSWNKNRLNSTVDIDPILTCQQVDPSNVIEANHSIDFGSTSSIFYLTPTMAGIYKIKLFLNYDFNMFINFDANNDGDLSLNANLKINNLNGPSWVFTNGGTINGPINEDYVNMRDLGQTVYFWLNFNITGKYTLKLQIYGPNALSVPMKTIKLTQGTNSSNYVTLNPAKAPSVNKYMSFFINQSQTGLWKLEYSEELAWEYQFYFFQMRDPNLMVRRFYLPLDDSSAPNIDFTINQSTTGNNLTSDNNQPDTIFTQSLPISFTSILGAILILPIFRKKKC